MAVKSTAAPVAEPTTSWENPLIPNKRLRKLYASMVELRLLGEHLGKSKRRAPSLSFLHSEEGCLVSTVFSLSPGDLTSEFLSGAAIKFLRDSRLSELANHAFATKENLPASKLPSPGDAIARLHIAVGAATAISTKNKSPLVAAYIHAGDLTLQQWNPVLKLAAAHKAPIFFVVLPHPIKTAKPGQLSLIATACGVPGIPVDAADPVALYRVAQESMLRIRAGGGPVMMECIPFQLPGKQAAPADPILTMQQFMLPRGVATQAWFEAVETRFAARLTSAAQYRRSVG